MIQSILVACAVVACALYWTGRLFPRARLSAWGMIAATLQRMGAPERWRTIAARRATPRTGGGCGGCSGCAGTSCTPDEKQKAGSK